MSTHVRSIYPSLIASALVLALALPASALAAAPTVSNASAAGVTGC
jgi:hypothetical protein